HSLFYLFLFIVPAPTEIYTLSLHDALPISQDADEARHLLAEEGDEDLVLRLEVEVDGAAGDPRLARDVRHARVVEAVAREHAHGRVDDLLGLVGIAHGSD